MRNKLRSTDDHRTTVAHNNELATTWHTMARRYGGENLTTRQVGKGVYLITVTDDTQGAGHLNYTERFDETYRAGDDGAELPGATKWDDEYVPTEFDLAWMPKRQKGHWIVKQWERFDEPGVREFLNKVCDAIEARTGKRPRRAPVRKGSDELGVFYEARLWVAAPKTEE